MISVKAVEIEIPKIIDQASPAHTGSPIIVREPSMVVREVKMIGLILVIPAWIKASSAV